MKNKISLLLLCCTLIFSFVSCSDDKIGDLPEIIEPEGEVNDTINVLLFGNSFTRDAFSYVPAVLKMVDPKLHFKIAIAYIGGSPLAQHLASFSGESKTVDNITYHPKKYDVTVSVNGSPWSDAAPYSAIDLLNSDKWNIITFQQNGQGSYKNFDEYYRPFLYPLLDLLSSNLTYEYKLGWVLIHGSYGNNGQQLYEHWSGACANAQKVMETTNAQLIFPYGTAIQNLRETELASLGDGPGRNLLADVAHIQEGIGCLCAAYANAQTILNNVATNHKSIIGNNIYVDMNFILKNNIPETNFGSSNSIIGISEENIHLAQIAALNAVEHPYQTTPFE